MVQREAMEDEIATKPIAGMVQREAMEDEIATKPIAGMVQREAMEDEIATKPIAGMVQREAMEDEIATKPISGMVQRQAMPRSEDGFDASAGVESEINSMKGGGQKMDGAIQAKMESAFGADFSNVNIHTGSKASEVSESLGAEAFATGNDIFFREGNYNPDSHKGQELLGHELTHVLQQGS
uniref:eCIS core domain-containing protein n=2 Tax=Paenibacillus athensensis TaxID=1967502 RepID=A0A4Y8PQS6_9BACL